jgi:hypothetical protein
MAEDETPIHTSTRSSVDASALQRANTTSLLDSASKLIQVLSVVAGVIISVLSFNAARETEARAREAEAKTKELELKKYYDGRKDETDKRRAEAAKPFLELRQRAYLEAVQAAGILANPQDHSEGELKKARTRFRQLYVAELSLVEGAGVEQGMMGLAEAVDPELKTMTKEQVAAYELAHALRDSLIESWGLDKTLVDNPN